jgi:hypothetical protein
MVTTKITMMMAILATEMTVTDTDTATAVTETDTKAT